MKGASFIFFQNKETDNKICASSLQKRKTEDLQKEKLLLTLAFI